MEKVIWDMYSMKGVWENEVVDCVFCEYEVNNSFFMNLVWYLFVYFEF